MSGADFRLYGTAECRYCREAKRLLDSLDHAYEGVDLGDPAARARFYAEHGFAGAEATVPKIWHRGRFVGGFRELEAFVVELEGGGA